MACNFTCRAADGSPCYTLDTALMLHVASASAGPGASSLWLADATLQSLAPPQRLRTSFAFVVQLQANYSSRTVTVAANSTAPGATLTYASLTLPVFGACEFRFLHVLVWGNAHLP